MLSIAKIALYFRRSCMHYYLCIENPDMTGYTHDERMENRLYTYRHPHPAVVTDCVVFGYDGESLFLLLIERGRDPFKGCWALPGGFVEIDETVEEGARRELEEETDIRDIHLEQFHVFSALDRDPRERVISVAFLALVRKSAFKAIGGDDAVRTEWFRTDSLPPLAFDHAEIIAKALERLIETLKIKPIAPWLLDKGFNIEELQRICELIIRP